MVLRCDSTHLFGTHMAHIEVNPYLRMCVPLCVCTPMCVNPGGYINTPDDTVARWDSELVPCDACRAG